MNAKNEDDKEGDIFDNIDSEDSEPHYIQVKKEIPSDNEFFNM